MNSFEPSIDPAVLKDVEADLRKVVMGAAKPDIVSVAKCATEFLGDDFIAVEAMKILSLVESVFTTHEMMYGALDDTSNTEDWRGALKAGLEDSLSGTVPGIGDLLSRLPLDNKDERILFSGESAKAMLEAKVRGLTPLQVLESFGLMMDTLEGWIAELVARGEGKPKRTRRTNAQITDDAKGTPGLEELIISLALAHDKLDVIMGLLTVEGSPGC
ncbi:hypothetical protein UFOVP1299_4 [uncultured Caudovirales phage]|uniref:Uncharacterized protein n=1 Tax=uncultured Caudovirales phage TaxID=2100421 RepID=A0A6J5RNU5_9CAUD|nr:hypothetical protein UFOVP1299_4 [uncultured Caudovirales phage]